MVIFHQMLSSIQTCFLWKVVCHQRIYSSTVCLWSNHLLEIISSCIYLKSLCYSVTVLLSKLVEVVLLLVLLLLLLIHLFLLRLPILAEEVLVGNIHRRSTRSNNYYKVNRCLARYSPRATTTNRPTTWHRISLHGLAQIDQKCQFWAKFGRFGAKNPFFYLRN